MKVKFFKNRKTVIIPLILIIVCIVVYLIFAIPIIERHTWKLSFAQQTEPYIVIAHDKDYDLSDDGLLFGASKPIELTCEAKNGKLTITDKTNGKVYKGTYKVTSFKPYQSYKIVIDGKEGIANISNTDIFNRTLFMSIDGYALNFSS